MGLLKFNGSADKLKWESISADLQNVPTAAWTFLFGIRHNNLLNWQGYGYLLSGTGDGVAQMGLSKSTSGTNDIWCDATTVGDLSWATLDPVASQNTLYVASKPSGNAVANLSKKVNATGAWSHAASVQSKPNALAAAQLQIGTWQWSAIDLLNGWMAVAAIWDVELTQAQRIACGANWKTSDIWKAHPKPPLLLMEFNVPAVDLKNLGPATVDTQTVVGTTVDSAQNFGNWNFDGFGSGFLSV